MTSNAVAIALTLALPRVFVLIKRLIPRISRLMDRIAEPNFLNTCRRTYDLVSNSMCRLLGVRTSTSTTEENSLELAIEHLQGTVITIVELWLVYQKHCKALPAPRIQFLG